MTTPSATQNFTAIGTAPAGPEAAMPTHNAPPPVGHPALAGLRARVAAVANTVRRKAENHARRGLARRTRQTLEWIDDRTLRDMGLVRSEISSIASEVAGDAEVTRLRIGLSAHHWPGPTSRTTRDLS